MLANVLQDILIDPIFAMSAIPNVSTVQVSFQITVLVVNAVDHSIKIRYFYYYTVDSIPHPHPTYLLIKSVPKLCQFLLTEK